MVVLLRLASHDSKPFVNAKGSNTQHSIVSIVRRHTNFRSHLCESFYYKYNTHMELGSVQSNASDSWSSCLCRCWCRAATCSSSSSS